MEMLEKLIKNCGKICLGNKILFCFPFAGGGPAAFNEWIRVLKKLVNVTVCPIQLPGREERIMETPYVDMKLLIDDLYQVISKYSEYKLFFFGHSMGAKVAYEVAKRMEENGNIISHLIVSGSRTPHIPEPNPIYQLNDEDFKKGIERFEGTPKEILDNEELMGFFLPMLRADFTMDETYSTKNNTVLRCPITAFGGTLDKEADKNAILQWKEYTSNDFQTYFYEGGHFFIKEREREVLDRVAEILNT